MDIKVSVIIICTNSNLHMDDCIKSFRGQRIAGLEILCLEEAECKILLAKASGEYILFAGGNEIADRELLEKAVKCAEDSGAEIVFLPRKQFDHKSVSLTGPMVYEPCLESKLFRKEYIIDNFKYILRDDIKYNKYMGLSLLSGTENIVTMSASRLYLLSNKKINGDEILQNYTLLYEDLCRRDKWNETKQRFLNWFLTDTFLWLDGGYITSDMKNGLKKIKNKLLIKPGNLNYSDEYFTSVYSRNGALWIKGIDIGERFNARHNTDYKNIIIHRIKENQCKKTPLISVIMPVFNVENYVVEALDSLENQTFKEFEIICVDDCSTDHSLEILIEYANANPNPCISIYHQQNCGQSVARNHGLKYARGKYIYFMDSDDILQSTALEMLYNHCEQNDLDVVYFDGEVFFDLPEDNTANKQYKNYYKRVGGYQKTVYTGPELMREMWVNSEYRVAPCLQLIKKKHIVNHGLLFPQGIIHEDNAFSFLCMIQAERVGYYGIELYHRRIRCDSTMTKKSTFENVYGYLSCYILIFNWLQNNIISDRYYQMMYELLDSLIHSAKYHYDILDGVERNLINYLKPYERFLCQKFFVEKDG